MLQLSICGPTGSKTNKQTESDQANEENSKQQWLQFLNSRPCNAYIAEPETGGGAVGGESAREHGRTHTRTRKRGTAQAVTTESDGRDSVLLVALFCLFTYSICFKADEMKLLGLY